MFKQGNRDFAQLSYWEKLGRQILPHVTASYPHSYRTLGFYDLVSVVVDDDERPLRYAPHPDDVASYLIFTDAGQIKKMSRSYSEIEILKAEFDPIVPGKLKTKVYMLGDLVESLCPHDQRPEAIKVNPILWREEGEEFPFILCEEVLFSPIKDQVTKKNMMTDPENAMALLAIDPSDQERFGIEIVFHALNYNDLSEDIEQRQEELKKELKKMAFFVPRVPMRKGSGNFYCCLLNLENPIEEMAFVRNYPSFEGFIDPVFVTSSFELLSGNLEHIPYDGEKIDTIFTPLINWQKLKRCKDEF